MSFDCITLSSDSSRSSSPHLADSLNDINEGSTLYNEESREFHQIKEDTSPVKATRNLFSLSDTDSESTLKRSNSIDSIARIEFNRNYEDTSPIKTNSNVFSLSDTDSESNSKQCSSQNSLATSSLKVNNFDDVSTQQKRKRGTKISAEERNRIKSIKLAEKKALQASKEYQRSLQPKECLKYVTAIIEPKILKFECMIGLEERLIEKEVKFKINSHSAQGTVMWTREILGTQNNCGSISAKEEDHVLLCISAGDITRLVLDETLTSHVASIKDFFPDKHITLVLCGMEEYIKAGKEKRCGKVAPKPQVFRKTLEASLVNIQLMYSIGHRTVENSTEFALLISMFTKAVAETPFKRDRQEREMGGVLSWFARGDSKDCVRVSNTGTGCSLLWHQQLTQFNNVGLDVAKAVTSVYASPQELFKSYQECDSEIAAEKLLQNIEIHRRCGPLTSSRKLGPELSRKIYIFFTSTNGNQFLSGN